MEDTYLWWRDGVIYQIYPRSFADSNGDGIGDLRGILGKLDYLQALGIDALWLSPIYPSPDVDYGYDVSDHCAIDPRLGTLADFEQLVAHAHHRGIRIILDLVLNHTSDQHPWFQESRADSTNPKRDWYLWQPSIPNNWQSVFGGGGWELDTQTGEYYFHMFVKEQPDVNWRNPQVWQAQLDVVRFWMSKGVNGFRLDVFNAYFKHKELQSNPAKFGLRAFDRQHHKNDIDQPEMMGLLQELRTILDSQPETYAVGETFLATPERTASYCGSDKLHAAFNFTFTKQPCKPECFKKAILDWDRVTGDGVWPNYVLSNHDLPRTATRYARDGRGAGLSGPGKRYEEVDRAACNQDARLSGNHIHLEDDTYPALAMAMFLTLRGTPFLYYGEEIGMRDIRLKRKEILDPPGRYYWPFFVGRDGCRSPMQWDHTPAPTFWLPFHPNCLWRNVEAQDNNPDSLLHLTRNLIALRKEQPALRQGKMEFAPSTSRASLHYRRILGDQRIRVELDFSKQALMPTGLAGDEELLFEAWGSRIRIVKES
jgi:alpha-glucosidase